MAQPLIKSPKSLPDTTRLVLVKTGHRSARQHFAPPLGVLSLASFLHERLPGVQIEIIDMLPRGLSIEEVVKKTLDYEPDVVGISAMSYEALELHEIAAGIKQKRPRLPVISGGPHCTTAPRKVLADSNIDYAVRGEGEQTLLDLIPRIMAGESEPEDICGIGFQKNGEPHLTPTSEEIVDMDSLPLPAFDLIDLSDYWDLPRFGTTYVRREYATLATSRACPFQCTFCHRIFGSRYRSQSPQIVLRDLQTLASEFGVREIQFVDDCFNLKSERVAAICDGIVKQGLDLAICFPNGIRGDIMDEDTLKKLKAAGTYRITYAVETASERIQKFVKKNVKLGKLKKVIEMTDALGIMVDGFFMVGFPGETREEVQTTLDYALDSKLHSLNFWFVTPFPGTELYDQAKDMGYEVTEDAINLHYFDPMTDLSEVPAEELRRLVQKTFIRFYLNPWRWWRIFKLLPNKKQLPALLLRFIKFSVKWS